MPTKVKERTAPLAETAVLEREPVAEMPAVIEDSALSAESIALPEIVATQVATFCVQTAELRKVVGLLKKVVAKKPLIPILENVLFECVNGAVYIRACNLDKGEVRAYLGYADGADCTVCVPFRDVETVAKSKRNAIEFAVMDNGTVNVLADGVSYNVACADADAFPLAMALEGGGKTAVMRSEALASVLRRALVCASKEDIKPAMRSVYTEGFKTFVGTNAHTLCAITRNDTTLANDANVILPDAACEWILKAIKDQSPYVVAFAVEDYTVRATVGNVSITFRAIDARYPDWRDVVPSTSNSNVTISADELAETLRAILPFTNSITHLVVVKLCPEGLEIKNHNGESAPLGETEVTADVAATVKAAEMGMEIGFNAEQLISVVEMFAGQTVQLGLGNPGRAMVIEPVVNSRGEKATGLIMPLMLSHGYY